MQGPFVNYFYLTFLTENLSVKIHLKFKNFFYRNNLRNKFEGKIRFLSQKFEF